MDTTEPSGQRDESFGQKLYDMGWRQGTIVAESSLEPYIEVLICEIVNDKYAARVERNSARAFVIDPKTRLTAQARYRPTIAKEEIPAADYFATRLLFLEYHTYLGDEVQGAKPYPRA